MKKNGTTLNRTTGTKAEIRALENMSLDPAALEMLKSEKIEVEFCDLQPPEYGFYAWHPQTDPVIGLAHRLKFDRVMLRCVLWEGLGYHATTPELLRQTPFVLRSTMQRDGPDGLENAALRWAASQLIGRVEIRWWLRNGGSTLADFAAAFKVTPEIAFERLNSVQAYFPGLRELLERDK